MDKQTVLTHLKETRVIDTSMLKVIGMSFEIFLQYAQLSKEAQDRVVSKAIKKLGGTDY